MAARWARRVGPGVFTERRHQPDRCPGGGTGGPCRCGGLAGADVALDRHAFEEVDHEDFEHLYRELGPRLHGFVRRAEPLDADDITADVWLAVARYLPQFRGDRDGFEALVFTIARRRISDHRRKRARRKTDAVANDALADRPGTEHPDVEAIDLLRTKATLEELLRTLPRAQVEVVVLRVVHGLPVDRVAELLGRSPGSVRILQHRALKRLRA